MNRRDFAGSLVALLTTTTVSTLTIESVFARIGRPLSPNSVSGVRRRTRRRTRRRARRRVHRNSVLYSLPHGCHTTRHRNGVKYYHCNGVWYRPAFKGTRVVYVVEDIEDNATVEVDIDVWED